MAHRMAMASKEIDEIKRKFEMHRETARRRKASLRAEIEELEIRVTEIQESKVELEDAVIIRGIESITGKIPAEKITR